jgi:N-formylglutamate amidohydrolase
MWNIDYQSVNLVASHRGTLPVLITCPHGGQAAPDDVPERQGQATPSGCNFEKGSDLHTREIAQGVAQRMLELFGEAPSVVIAQFHRKFIDANRSRRCAFESPAAARYYDEYHRTLRAFADDPADIYLGTANGQTVARLMAADPQALWRRRSLRGFLLAAGHGVSPRQPGDAEVPSLSGGFTVRQYGSSHADGLDAMQLEIIDTLRKSEGARYVLVEQLAFAFGNLAHRQVDLRKPSAAAGAGV